MNNGKTSIWPEIELIRSKAPLIHNITNYVVMSITADALIAIGASPVMAHAVEEAEEMTGIAQALVINIGTLSDAWIKSMIKSGIEANKRNIPVVFDPVGSGATGYRTDTARQLIKEIHPSVIRGNASEIRSLIRSNSGTKGVDSIHTPEDVINDARELSSSFNCVVSVSGSVDLIVERNTVVRIANGHPLMSMVTGMGCTASAITGAFMAVNSSPFKAAINTMGLMGIAGEIAAERSSGPGSFKINFLDALYNVQESDIVNRLKIQGI
ncbi:MAG: hydroxyethylthiazole kinase [Desulfatiglans sp.]|nr:hydroxyethylthiazole kinase [Desulfatiglans sp.]